MLNEIQGNTMKKRLQGCGKMPCNYLQPPQNKTMNCPTFMLIFIHCICVLAGDNQLRIYIFIASFFCLGR